MRRGRPDRELRVGDPIDFWRVEVYDPPFHLRLSAEMKSSRHGLARIRSEAGRPGSSITQTAIFYPAGLAGLAYWYGIYPVHAVIFREMIKTIAQRAERS